MRVQNTLTGQKEPFQPAGDVVRLYVCGPTPYDTAHVGHAMAYVVFDAVRRYLEYRGYRVRHVQNFTDIDDKIIQRAQRLGIVPQELAERYVGAFFADMDALNVRRAHVYPRATGEIPAIVEMIEALIAKGNAYVVDGDVYFRVRTASDYGKLAHRSLDDLEAGARVEVDERKEDPLDFALWKSAKPGEPSWPSPWGPGRPGWHIECSAMSLRHLGWPIDLHGGGHDLIFPHHENEIAQSECFLGREPFVRYWLHNGLLRLGEQKMSKSLGNLVTIRELLERVTADGARLFLLSSHYRSPLTFTDEAVAAAERGAERLRQALRPGGSAAGAVFEGLGAAMAATVERFESAMDDDFNTPPAVAALFDLAREINRARDEGRDVEEAQETLRELGGVLGLTLRAPAEAKGGEVSPLVDLLLAVRAELRAQRQWALADRIRDELGRLGVVVEDHPEGSTWRRAAAGTSE
ncbi:MAG: cysteine--tRNA ligase [Chloroflexi bacterium]|nr:cysteine--tRNA ligase [Chloroflexota bacterium]